MAKTLRGQEIALARDSMAGFDISGSFRLVHRGLDMAYRVQSDDRRTFAMRVSRGITIRRVSAYRVEAEWIDALFGNSWCDIPELIRSSDGDRITQVDDVDGVKRASTLLKWMPGRRAFRITQTQARSLDQLTGALHHHCQINTRPSADAIKTWDAAFMCVMGSKDDLHHFAPEVVNLVEGILAKLKQQYEAMNPDELGLINADVGLHNVLWHKGRLGIFYFNDSGIGPYAFCLGQLMERIRLHENGSALADALLKGYEDVTPLPDAYVKHGKLFEMAAALFKRSFRASRVAESGATLTEREQHALQLLSRQLEQL